jgi:hypothetical protein
MRLVTSTAPNIFVGSGLFIGSLKAAFCILLLAACSSDPALEQIEVDVAIDGGSVAEGGPIPEDDQAIDGSSVAEIDQATEGDPVIFEEDPFSEDPFAEAEAVEFDPNVEEAVVDEPAVDEPITTEDNADSVDEPQDQEPEPSGESEQPAAPQEPEEFIFNEDPLSDADTQIVGSESDDLSKMDHLWKGDRPSSQLLELEAAPEPNYDEDLIEQSAELALAKLRARMVADELSREAKVLVPPGVRTFGELLPVIFETRNPFGDTVELIPPMTGLLLELDWTVERWLPIGSSDKVKRHRYFRLNQWFMLEADQTFQEYTDIPLQLNGDAGSVWVVEVDARIRCAGAVFGDKQLPVHEIEFAAARFLVLPPGWEKYEKDPLASLERVLSMPSGEVDRHVLVCVALLRGQDRHLGVDALIQGLEDAPNDRRKLTITQALQWLTGVQIGSLPEDWLKWAELRKLSAVQTGTDHESTPGNSTSQ